jgi:hypothetical protein
MTIIELMQKENARVSLGNRWIVREEDGSFTVYSREYGQCFTRTLIKDTTEEQAVALLYEEQETAARVVACASRNL